MATHFQIIKGKSSSFFNPDGSYTSKLQNNLIENCWYLVTDTAEVYVALKENNSIKLKKINNVDIDADVLNSTLASVETRITALEEKPLGDADYGEV